MGPAKAKATWKFSKFSTICYVAFFKSVLYIFMHTFVEGDTMDRKVPNANEHCTTKTITAQQMKNRLASGFKLAIQYAIDIKIIGRTMKLGILSK